jgi:hypothetical protein
MNKVKVSELEVGDKFRFGFYGHPYLVIDMDFKNFSLHADFSNLVAVLDLVTYKVIGFNGDTKVEQDKDNIPV